MAEEENKEEVDLGEKLEKLVEEIKEVIHVNRSLFVI